MPDVVVDPDEVRHFAAVLERESAEIRSQLGAVRSRIDSASDAWSDVRYSQFERRFAEASAAILRFCAQSDEFVRYLIADARYIEDYLDRRV